MLWVLKNIYKFIGKFIRLYRQDKSYIYKIEEINECLNRIVISCRGKGAILVTTIEEIGNDDYIVNFLPPHHACWLGYHFGKKWSAQKEEKKQSNYSTYPLHHDSKFKIVYQNRSGEIIYQNSQSNIIYKMDLLELAKSKVISKFNSSQAFYIGFLAALRNAKQKNKSQPIKTFRHLKVVQ